MSGICIHKEVMVLKLRWLALGLVMGADEVVGWRRDGTGIYPNVTPPTKWQQISETIAGLRFQATPPNGDAVSGTPMPDGIIREWRSQDRSRTRTMR